MPYFWQLLSIIFFTMVKIIFGGQNEGVEDNFILDDFFATKNKKTLFLTEKSLLKIIFYYFTNQKNLLKIINFNPKNKFYYFDGFFLP
jgi:hypothetical protein